MSFTQSYHSYTHDNFPVEWSYHNLYHTYTHNRHYTPIHYAYNYYSIRVINDYSDNSTNYLPNYGSYNYHNLSSHN